MSPKDAFARDLVQNSDPRLDLKWSQPILVRDEYRARQDSLSQAGTDCTGDPGLTDQSQAAETDVNLIVKRAIKSGVMPGIDIQKIYADVSGAVDYHTAKNLILNAENQFNSLDAAVRIRFENDPAQFLAFVEDPKNAAELVKLGLAEAFPDSLPPAVPAVVSPDPQASQPIADKASGVGT